MEHGIDGTEIGVAVVGFGLAGRVFHAPFVRAVPGLRLRSIVQRHGDQAALAYPVETTGVSIVRSFDQVLQDPAVDLVVVATPNETHFDLATAALQAGKHVVVDKPIAGNARAVRQLQTLSVERGRVLAPFHNRRWDGDFLTIRTLLAGGVLGRLVAFHSSFDRFRPAPRGGTWKEAAGPASGLLFDLGPHLVDQALALFGMPRTLTGSVRRERGGTEIEDAFDLVLEFEHGLRVTLSSTMIAAEPGPRFAVHGTSGSFRKWGVDPQEPALVGGATVPPVGSDIPWLQEPETAWGDLALAPDPAGAPKQIVRRRVETAPGDYRAFYVNVRDAIRGTAPLAVTPEDAWRTIRLLELARESSSAGQTLPVAL